ncbi:glycosyltransferase family 4 protein [Sclerotinia borealis F-4128]|uniref:Glycosyltransferase family 4 protein n=1 Tax=Sclerotinia borealis (strain F-4128) TaxID=1432307 RepID=W9CEA6_SCLBF|nr:glycosyltransferase family 4 protein [Sclerotinia borealis F-4128]
MNSSNDHPKKDEPLEFPEALKGKRILLATESFGPVNGVSRTTLNLVEYLRGNGVFVAVVAPHYSTGAAPIASTTNSNNQIELRLKGYPLPYNPELSIVYPVRLSQLYARTFGSKPDLIYLASPASLGFQILLQLRQQQRTSQVPVMLNFQTDLSGYCEILFPAPLDRWAVWVFGSVQGYLFRWEGVKTIFYPSRFVKRYLAKTGIQEEKMENLRREVDGSMFHPSKRLEKLRKDWAPNGELIMICVARLAPEKGFGFLSEVVKELDGRDFHFKLIIVGGNQSQKVEQEIRGLFEALVAEGKVVFTGTLRGEALAAAYASADIFLHCSITETFGLVVLESMASGVPPIGNVADNKFGYLVAPSNLTGFVEKVLLLSNRSQLRSAMSIECRRMAEEATWDSIGNRVAWKMAEALKSPKSITNAPPDTKIPLYSWLLMTEGLRNLLVSFIVDAKLFAGLGIIFGIWFGLIVTWILVRISIRLRM